MQSKADAGKFDIATPTHLHRTVVQTVRAGGLRALKPRRSRRRVGAGAPSSVQLTRIRELIVHSLPDQLKRPFHFWTQAAAVALIECEYSVSVTPPTVGRYLSGSGMSREKPVRWACERNDIAIDHGLLTEYSVIVGQARQDRATICWGDEMRLSSDCVGDASLALDGHTPIERATGQRCGCGMISAVSIRRHLAFTAFDGESDGRLLIRFVQRLPNQALGELHLIVDGHPAHLSVTAKTFVRANEGRLCLIRLPRCVPEPIADELLNRDRKTNGLTKRPTRNRTEMMAMS
jgi:transposase